MDRGQLELLNLALELKTANMPLAVLVDRYLKMTRKRKARTVWVRHWITLRPHQGAYGNLMTILRTEDGESFKNFTRLSPQMFADMVHRLTPRLQKYHTENLCQLVSSWRSLSAAWLQETTTVLSCISSTCPTTPDSMKSAIPQNPYPSLSSAEVRKYP